MIKIKKILVLTSALSVLLLTWPATTEVRPSVSRENECEFGEARLPYYGSVFIEKRGPAHIFLNYMGIVISASEEAFQFEFKRCANQYIKQSGGVPLLVGPADLYEPSNMREIEPSGMMVFWSWRNCIKTALRAKLLKKFLDKKKRLVLIPPVVIPLTFDPSMLPAEPHWDPPPDFIWPDPGDTFEQLEKARRDWKKKPPWWPPGVPWPFNGDDLWRLPSEVSHITLPKIFEEDSNKIARFLNLPKSGHPLFFHIYMSQINLDGTLSRRRIAIIKKEPDGRIIQQPISPLLR